MFVVEPLATLCNFGSNAIILHAICRDPSAAVPRAALSLQVCANLLWLTFATLSRDVFLLLTALASLHMQLASLVLRLRVAPPLAPPPERSAERSAERQPIQSDASTDSLPAFPTTPQRVAMLTTSES